MTEIEAYLAGLRPDFFCTLIDDKPENKFSCGFYTADGLLRVDRKYDEYFAFIYVLDGEGAYTDYLGRSTRYTPGMCLVRHPGTTFRIVRNPTPGGRILEFASALPACFAQALRALDLIPPDVTWLDPGLSLPLVHLCEEYLAAVREARSRAARFHAFGKFLELFSTFLIYDERRHAEPPDGNEAALRQAALLLADELDREVGMKAIAAKVGMGYEHFRKCFHARYGISPQSYRLQCKMRKADAYLIHTGLSVKEIAALLGYRSTSTFSRQYALTNRRSPGELRRNPRGTGNAADNQPIASEHGVSPSSAMSQVRTGGN